MTAHPWAARRMFFNNLLSFADFKEHHECIPAG